MIPISPQTRVILDNTRNFGFRENGDRVPFRSELLLHGPLRRHAAALLAPHFEAGSGELPAPGPGPACYRVAAEPPLLLLRWGGGVRAQLQQPPSPEGGVPCVRDAAARLGRPHRPDDAAEEGDGAVVPRAGVGGGRGGGDGGLVGNGGERVPAELQLAWLFGDCGDGEAFRAQSSGRDGLPSVWFGPR